MEKLYYQVPYIKTFDAAVVSCREGKNGYEVVLDRTGFYPEGGGQPADTGYLGDVRVLDVHEKQGEILHYTEAPLEEGGCVTGVIDWEQRYANMQQHTGEHLFSGLVHRRFGYDNVGFHMGSEEMTIDFNGPLTIGEAERLEQEANRLIYDNLPVRQLYPTEEELHNMEYRSKKELTGQVRIIEIPGGDTCACCGTHVEKTGEIGIIKVTGLINYKGGVRMTMRCGRQALLDYERKQNDVARISVLLSAKQDAIVEAVERLKQNDAEKEYLIQGLYRQLFEAKTEKLPSQNGSLLLFEEELSPVLIRTFCTMLCEQGKGEVIAVCSGEEDRYQYALGSQTQDMRVLSKELNAKLSGRGGGSASMARGTWMASKEAIIEVFEAYAKKTGEKPGDLERETRS